MGALDEYLTTLSNLPPEKREEVVQEAFDATRHRIWVPNPGPQTDAYLSLADETLYGGEAGGGKTDLVVGLSLTEHKRSLVLRRTNAEAVKLFDRFQEIIGSSAGKNEQKGWKINGRIIDIGGCQLEQDKQKRKGIPHDLKCVGRDTPILMGDGSLKPVQDVVVGDQVATLEGPRRVLRAFQTGTKPAVMLSVSLPGGARVTQAQSAGHKVLMRNGWASPGTSSASSPGLLLAVSSSRSCAFCKGRPMTSHTYGSASQGHRTRSRSLQRTSLPQEVAIDSRSSPNLLALLSGMASQALETGCARFGDGLQRVWRRLGYYLSGPMPLIPFSPIAAPLYACSSQVRDGGGVQRTSLRQGFPAGYQSESRSGDERTPGSSDRYVGLAASQPYPLQSADAVAQSPIDCKEVNSGRTPRHSLHKWSYSHPYTMGTRRSYVPVVDRPYSVSPLPDQRFYDLEVEEVNHFITDGGIVNQNCFDELVDFSRTQYEFIIAWNRSTDPHQRCRVVATTNPPTRPEGMWVVERWAPWLDPNHPNPAMDGELRWFTTIDGKDTEVDGPGPHDDGTGRQVMAKSRTFIRAKLQDNPDLTQNDDYESRLSALPKELREAYMEGRFEAGLKDTPFQAIPTDWIRQAQERWTEKPPKGIPMCGIGVDMSGGGSDPMIIAPRHDGWYPQLIEISAKMIPEDRPGKFAAGLVISYRRDRAIVVVDMGGGHGGGIYEQLKDNEIEVVGHKGMDGSVQRTAEGQLGFFNKRTQVIWRFREALDPSQPGGSPIMLPPDPMLLADLAAPTFEMMSGKIKVEAKKDVVARLGRSTDRGDAVVMAWSAGPTYVTDGEEWARAMKSSRPLGRTPQVIMGRNNRRN